MSGILETLMLVCFGISWPINVYKNYRAGTAKGMSLGFIMLIMLGYVAGICAKLINHNITYVLAVYVINLVIVSVNVIVYIRNTRLDKKAQ
jgi:lipopolysaccharide export LptBFGC system permease protein LptF